MAYKFASAEWVQAFVAEVNKSEAYRKAAATWEGDFYFIAEAGPAMPEPAIMYFDLWHGEARSGCLVASEGDKKPEFIIRASLEVWRKVVEKKLDPIQGMVTKKLKVAGTLSKIMRYTKAAVELVNCATKVPTEFPG
jgi:putative sterol carrier protein